MKMDKITIKIIVEGGCVQEVEIENLPAGLDFEYDVIDLDIADEEDYEEDDDY
jgi:hypothetical protein